MSRSIDVAEFRCNEKTHIIYRTQEEIAPLDLLDTLASSTDFPLIYFAHRDESKIFAGLGKILESETIPEICCLRSLQGKTFDLPFFGGRSFDPNVDKPHPFKNFKETYFFLPRTLIIQENHQYFLVRHALDLNEIQLKEKITTSNRPKNPFKVFGLTHHPDLDTWRKQIHDLTLKMKSNELKKAVIARHTHIQIDQPINPFETLKHLQDQFQNTTYFCFQFEPHISFLGATPECLYTRKKDQLFTEAIAGTAPSTGSTDLLNSTKEIDEFTYVTDFFNRRLKELSIKTQEGQNRIAHIGYLHHLYRSFQAELKDEMTDFHLIEKLFPSPALCGTPTRDALDHIEKLEPFKRHWYAAPVGFISEHHAQMVIAIRSCLISNKEINLFVGNGIIESSDPDHEWEELNQKMTPFLNFFAYVNE